MERTVEYIATANHKKGIEKNIEVQSQVVEPSVKSKEVHEALFATAFRVSVYCFERFKFQVYSLINIFLHRRLYPLYSMQIVKDRRKVN